MLAMESHTGKAHRVPPQCAGSGENGRAISGEWVIEALREISGPMRRLSVYIAGALMQPLPPAVMEKARQHILDTMAAMISGTRLRPGRFAIDYVAKLVGVRQSSRVGTRFLTSPTQAPLANRMRA